MASMKSNVLKANKSAVCKQKKGSFSESAVMRRKLKQTFAAAGQCAAHRV